MLETFMLWRWVVWPHVWVYVCVMQMPLIHGTQELEGSQGQILMRHLIKIKPCPLIWSVVNKASRKGAWVPVLQEHVGGSPSLCVCWPGGKHSHFQLLGTRWESGLCHTTAEGEGMGLLKKTFQIRSTGQSNAPGKFKGLQRECSSLQRQVLAFASLGHSGWGRQLCLENWDWEEL